MSLTKEDIPGFFSVLSTLDANQFILAKYSFETYLEPRLAAATMCSEMSTAQWKRVGKDEDLREQFGAKAVGLKILSENKTSSFCSDSSIQHFYACEVEIAHPIRNFGYSIANLLAEVMGEGALYCPGITTIRLIDLKFPQKYLEKFNGPKFGIEGIRKKFKVYNRPFFIGVIKPNIGLPPEEMGELAYQAWLGGLDIAKDDEMLANPPWSQLSKRVSIISDYQAKATKVTKKIKNFLANISGDIEELSTNYRQAEQNGAGMVMVNGFFSGLSSIKFLEKKSKLPLIAHFTGMALWNKSPNYGIDDYVLIKLQRIMGADIIIMPGLGERMGSDEIQVKKNVEACLMPLGSIKQSLPVPGGSDWAGTLAKVYQVVGHPDFGFVCGRGVFGHPSGPKAGAKSLHQAWEACVREVSLLEYSLSKPELSKAIKAFGKQS